MPDGPNLAQNGDGPTPKALPTSFWDDYTANWRPNPAYEVQERGILAILAAQLPQNHPGLAKNGVLEAGPGFGRISKLLMAAYPALGDPGTPYHALDISAKGLEAAEANIPRPFTTKAVAPLEDTDPTNVLLAIGRRPALVVAVEVLMHIPPNRVRDAVNNLVRLAGPGGYLLTCDWTAWQGHDFEAKAAANGNWRHDYYHLYTGATRVAVSNLLLQTIYLVQP